MEMQRWRRTCPIGARCQVLLDAPDMYWTSISVSNSFENESRTALQQLHPWLPCPDSRAILYSRWMNSFPRGIIERKNVLPLQVSVSCTYVTWPRSCRTDCTNLNEGTCINLHQSVPNIQGFHRFPLLESHGYLSCQTLGLLTYIHTYT